MVPRGLDPTNPRGARPARPHSLEVSVMSWNSCLLTDGTGQAPGMKS